MLYTYGCTAKKKLLLNDTEKLSCKNKESFVIVRKLSKSLDLNSDCDFYRYFVGDKVVVNFNETLDVEKNEDGGVPYVNIACSPYKVVDRREISYCYYNSEQQELYGDYDKIVLISVKRINV